MFDIDKLDIIMKDEGSWFHVKPNNDKAHEFLQGVHKMNLCKGLVPCECSSFATRSFDIPRRSRNKLAKDAERAGLSVMEF